MAIYLKFVSEFQGAETRRNKLELPAGARDVLKYRPDGPACRERRGVRRIIEPEIGAGD
jgi:hypothetical protein